MLSEYKGWKVVRKIGEGSFGTVYEIEREDLGCITKAALKVISIPKTESEIASVRSNGMDDASISDYYQSLAAEIVKEVQMMTQLRGITNIVSYEDHEIRPKQNGIGWEIFIRMELLTSLTHYINDEAHPITRRDVIRLGIDICSALERCQKLNIIHRDIKPDNIMVSPLGDFKLGDFGIARTVERTSSEMSKKGTYSYMAPEVYKGMHYGYNVDIYSLGLVMYRLLNKNRNPFMPPFPQPIKYRDQEQALVHRMSGEPLPMPCEDNTRLAEIVLKACSYDPKDRYTSPRDMRSDLEAILYTTGDESCFTNRNDIIMTPPMEPTLSMSSRASNQPPVEEQSVRPEPSAIPGQQTAVQTEEGSSNDVEEEGTTSLFSGNVFDRFSEASSSDAPAAEAEEIVKEVVPPAEAEEIVQEVPIQGEENAESEAPGVEKSEEPGDYESDVSPQEERVGSDASAPIMESEGTTSLFETVYSSSKEYPEDSKPVAAAVADAEQEHSKEEKPKQETKSQSYHTLAEHELETMPRPKKSKAPLIGAVIALVLVLAGGFGIYSRMSTATIPDVSGMDRVQAQEAIKSAGFASIEEKTENSEVYGQGYVIRAEHQGERISKNGKVILVISLGEQITVPDAVGQKGDAVVGELQTAGLNVTTDTAYSKEFEEGVVISQSESAGTNLNEGDSIVLTISLGAKEVKVENFVGMKKNDAEKAAQKQGLVVALEEEFSKNGEKGKVISQSIKAGAKAVEGDQLTLVVGKGVEKVKVPDLVGKKKSEAEKALDKVGLNIGTLSSDYSDSVESGVILSQKPKAGSEADKGSSVSYTVSAGKKPASKSPKSSRSKKRRKKSSKKKKKKKSKKKSSKEKADFTW